MINKPEWNNQVEMLILKEPPDSRSDEDMKGEERKENQPGRALPFHVPRFLTMGRKKPRSRLKSDRVLKRRESREGYLNPITIIGLHPE